MSELNAQKGFQTLVFSEASIGDNNLVAAVAGQRVYVLGLMMTADGGAQTVAALHETGAAVLVSPNWALAADEKINLPLTHPSRYWMETSEGTGLDLNLGAATAVSGVLTYQQF